MTPAQRRILNAIAAAVHERARLRGADRIRFVQIDTSDGPITVSQCVRCGMLDPDLNPLHDGCYKVNKIPTIFVRDMSRQPALVIPEWVPGTEWVRDGEGMATRKYDGTSCLVRDGKLYKRRELRPGDICPADFELLGVDENTRKAVGWIPVGDGPEDRWHREAFQGEPDGTYELVGPKIQGNKDRQDEHRLQLHAGAEQFPGAPREFDALRAWLTEIVIEGLVWHHPDGRMAKIKRRDFGLKW